MGIFRTTIILLGFLTICSSTETQTTGILLPNNDTSTIGHTLALVNKSDAHSQRTERETSANNHIVEQNLVSLDPKGQHKTQLITPKSKSMTIPMNFVINNKPHNKIPNSVKAPAQHVQMPAVSNLPKSAIRKVTAQDKVTPKSILSLRTKTRDDNKHNRKNILNSVDFFEDDNDTNFESLPPEPKQARKHKRPENKTGLSKDNQNNMKLEHKNDKNHSKDITHISNGTHSIRIAKLPPNKQCSDSKKPIEHFLAHDNALEDLLEPVGNKKEEITLSMLVNNNNEYDSAAKPMEPISCITEPVITEMPIITQTTDEDPANIITITNHNYEEVEEKSGTSFDNKKDADQEFTTPLRQATASPCMDILQNYQATLYDQYLKYIVNNIPGLYSKENCSPCISVPEASNFDNNPDFIQALSTTDNQVAQDVFYGQKPNCNMIDIRPENNLGRIWRTWKDTEIKISKPNVFFNKPLDCGRKLNNVNFADMIGKTPSLYETVALGSNGYFNNLNNPLAYSYPYRYMM